MKKPLLLIAGLIFCTSILAQIPQGITHQAVIRNTANELITLTEIGIRVSIIQGEPVPDETIVYQETHLPQSNAHGLITYIIGQGNPEPGFQVENFENIDWAAGPYFLKTEVDPEGLDNYTIIGTMQFLSVPYALHAGSSSDNQWEQSGNNIISRNTGNVGIGINNPNEKLEVDGNARFGWESAGYLGLGGDFLGGEIGLFDISGDKIIAGKLYSGPESGTYVFGDNLFIHSGNVGIGTQNPIQKLHVAGNASFASDIGIGRGFIYDEIGMSDLLVDRLIAGKPNAETDLLYQYGGQPGTSEGLFINEGNVGIGTSSPSNRLTVLGNANFHGNLGIGTSTPVSTVHISSSSNSTPLYLQRLSNTTGHETGILFKVLAGGNDDYLKGGIFFERKAGSGRGDLHFALNNSTSTENVSLADTKMTITYGGNIGIGTTEPSQKLDVDGGVRIRSGNPGNGRVLKSDEFGNATWQDSFQPIAYGFVRYDGTLLSSTGNVLALWNETSEQYEITISGENYVHGSYVTLVTPVCAPSSFRTLSGSGKLVVIFYSSGITRIDCDFQFVTFKP